MAELDLGSVIGPQGPQGIQGIQGPTGPQGPAGQDATVDATLSVLGDAADAKVTGDAIAATQGMAAWVETSTTASQAYEVGDFLVYSGVLYKVTAAIAQGGTITVGTNVAATDTGSELTDLNDSISKLEVLVITMSSFTFGTTYNSTTGPTGTASIEDDMVVLKAVIATPSVQTADWTVTTGNGTFQISGQSGTCSSSVTLYLMKSR